MTRLSVAVRPSQAVVARIAALPPVQEVKLVRL